MRRTLGPRASARSAGRPTTPSGVKAKNAEYVADGRKALANRRSYLKRKYGITLERYDEMLAAQGGVCAICRREPNPKISLHVDHDHESGAIRGLTCFRCNQAMGAFAEDPTLLRAAAVYLEAHDPEIQALGALVDARVAALKRPA